MYTLLIREKFDFEPVRIYIAYKLKDILKNAELTSISVRDQIPDYQLMINKEKMEYEEMIFDIQERNFLENTKIELKITSETKNLETIKNFVINCHDWLKNEYRFQLKSNSEIQVYHFNYSKADWAFTSCIKKRSLDTVFYDYKMQINQKIGCFLEDDNSAKNFIVLLLGEHGTGKSTLIHALASYHDLQLAHYDLAQYLGGLTSIFNRLPKKSTLSIDNIDEVYAKTVKEDAYYTYSSFCSALDSFSENNCLIFLTASNRTNIDLHLLRKIDVVVEMPICKKNTTYEMIRYWRPKIDDEKIKQISEMAISRSCAPATLIKVLQYRDQTDPEFDFDDFEKMCNFHQDESKKMFN